MTTTSSHWWNLRPTSRSTPTGSKPSRSWTAIEASLWPHDACDHGVEPACGGHLHELGQHGTPDAAALVVGVDVDGVLDGVR